MSREWVKKELRHRSGLDQDWHEALDVGRRGLVAAALQQIDGVQFERFLVAPMDHPKLGKPGRRVLYPMLPGPGVLLSAEGV